MLYHFPFKDYWELVGSFFFFVLINLELEDSFKGEFLHFGGLLG